jgi:hypothetical protein
MFSDYLWPHTSCVWLCHSADVLHEQTQYCTVCFKCPSSHTTITSQVRNQDSQTAVHILDQQKGISTATEPENTRFHYK